MTWATFHEAIRSCRNLDTLSMAVIKLHSCEFAHTRVQNLYNHLEQRHDIIFVTKGNWLHRQIYLKHGWIVLLLYPQQHRLTLLLYMPVANCDISYLEFLARNLRVIIFWHLHVGYKNTKVLLDHVGKNFFKNIWFIDLCSAVWKI